MTNPYRAMCEELVTAVDLLCGSGDSPGQPGSRLILTVHVEALDELANRARALLAQPVAEGPTDEALLDLADDSDLDRFEGERSYPDGTVIKEGCWEAWDHQLLAFARAVLARWGHPTFQPPADGEVGELVELQWPASVAQGCHEAAAEAESGSPLQQLLVSAGDLLERIRPAAAPVAVLPDDALIIEPAEHTLLVPVAQPVPVSERLPEPSVKVLAYYFNALGNGRTICAIWVPAKTRSDEGDLDAEDFLEYDEEGDKYYWPEGWYEAIENWDELGWAKVYEGEIVYWQPLPKWPANALPTPTQ